MNRAPENNANSTTAPVPSQGMAPIEAQLNEAVDHHRAGRLFEAEEIYRRILAAEPDYPYALCLLGTIAQAGVLTIGSAAAGPAKAETTTVEIRYLQ